MKAASMFSGIGGAECALPEAEWVWCAEIEPFPCAVLDQRFGHANLGDVLADDFIDRARALGPLDLLCGGPPCQAFSVAGNRLSMADPRGNLSLRFVQVLHAIRPRNAAIENVPGWLNTPDNAFGCFLGAIVGGDGPLLPCAMPPLGKSNAGWKWRAAGKAWMLRELGEGDLPVYVESPDDHDPSEIQLVELDARHVPVWPSAGMASGPRARVAWRILDAQYSGLAQRRERVLVVVDFGDGADPASVLFERKGLLGNHPPRRETGEGVTGTLSARTQGGGGLGTDFEIGGGLAPVHSAFGGNNTSGPVDVAAALCSHGGPHGGPHGRQDFATETFVTVAPTLDANYGRLHGHDNQHIDGGGGLFVAHTLRPEGFDASEDGSGRGTPIVPVPYSIMPQNSGKDYKARVVDVAQPLMAGGPVGGNQGGDYICQPVAFSSKDYGNDATDDLSPTLRSMGHDKSHANGGGQVAIAFAENQRGELRTSDISPQVTCGGGKPGQDYPAVAFQERGREGGRNVEWQEDLAYSLNAPSGGGRRQELNIATEWAVRRLTVTECERLQGYEDNWTLIDFGSRRTVEPDMAEYLRAKGVIVEADNATGKLRTSAAADGPPIQKPRKRVGS